MRMTTTSGLQENHALSLTGYYFRRNCISWIFIWEIYQRQCFWWNTVARPSWAPGPNEHAFYIWDHKWACFYIFFLDNCIIYSTESYLWAKLLLMKWSAFFSSLSLWIFIALWYILEPFWQQPIYDYMMFSWFTKKQLIWSKHISF